MIKLVGIVAGLAVVLAGAWQLASLPGTVSAEIGGYAAEAPASVALSALVVLVALMCLCVSLIAALMRLPSRVRRWRHDRRRRTGETAITNTLIALAAGEKPDARREASRARALLGDTPQTLLLAAEAGRLAGRDDEATKAFQALSERSDASFLGYRGLLRQAIAREAWAEAATFARLAEEAHPGAAWVRQERAQRAIRAGHWAEALELAAPEGSTGAALATAAALAEADPAQGLRHARAAWNLDKSLAPAALAYAARLRADGKEARALATVTETWAMSPQPGLADFALESTADPLARVQVAKRLAAAAPNHPESEFLLARASLSANLTGEARRHAERAIAAGMNQRRVWLLAAEIEELEIGTTEAGRLAQREALRRAASADPDPVWRCDSCRADHAVWHAACPACSTPGSLRWSGARQSA